MAAIQTQDVFPTLQRSMLADGYEVIMDMEKSRGARFVDAKSGRTYLDFFSFFASNPIGFNHPRLNEPAFEKALLQAAKCKVSNSDIYTTHLAEFVDYFHKYFANDFERLFFIEGGALGVENAMKAAQDWKFRKNLARGKRGVGGQILHFQHAFHGRTGYTLTVTNTVPDKTDHFPKFNWPRVSCPAVQFPITPENTKSLKEREALSLQQIHRAFDQRGDDICAILLETIQSEGGDNHFSKEFLLELQKICRDREALLIFDEVQAGMCITGKVWAWQHFGVQPDLMAFGKKVQVCGTAAKLDRLNEVENVFRVSSRINSTWGGNLTDMVRSLQFMKIIREENLLQHVNQLGEKMLAELYRLSQSDERITNVRGRGFLMAFDLPDADFRNRLVDQLWDNGLMILRSGTRAIRIRPVLDLPEADAMEGLNLLRTTLKNFK